ncbi:aldose epimerase family protein [Labrenzia sp. 011]|uniref:aldose epimerase family protein n=1 Tax=Labrenzia sp. 011 TaxID=2171494 RepID=UPI000D51D246|nr:aldose epimerase family protein [Labrenzia sp. 011]PVB60475.1 galactose-1-epimerase [Labrenzia sp. 011]
MTGSLPFRLGASSPAVGRPFPSSARSRAGGQAGTGLRFADLEIRLMMTTTNGNEAISISNGRLSATVIPHGASLSDLRLSDCAAPLVLGYVNPDIYREDRQFMGAVIGRYANRIANGRFRLDGHTVDLERNERGERHLHGGNAGYWSRIWSVKERSAAKVSFELTGPAGEAGYPGSLHVVACYEIIDQATLRLSFEAACDRDTIVNICHHPYFNFAGSPSTDAHKLTIFSDHYLPSKDTLVPTGEIAPVTGTPFDFTSPRGLPKHKFNNTYPLHRLQAGPLAHAATLSCGDVEMELWTTQPGLHLYDGYKLSGSHAGHLGIPYPERSGICLEPQAWPDSPNRSHFPSAVLRANATYRQVNEYRF